MTFEVWSYVLMVSCASIESCGDFVRREILHLVLVSFLSLRVCKIENFIIGVIFSLLRFEYMEVSKSVESGFHCDK